VAIIPAATQDRMMDAAYRNLFCHPPYLICV